MTEAEALAAIRAKHLYANIRGYELGFYGAVVHWDRAWLDPGNTIFGAGPYMKVPVEVEGSELIIRVYPHERLRKRLAKELVWAPPPQEDG